MIRSLRIKNLAIIEDLEIEFKEGFNILTGETGAGKSIIIDGIRLALGEKASPDLIRTGQDKALIEVIFYFPDLEFLKDSFSEFSEENEIYIQREILVSGRGKGYINGTLVPINKLKELGEKLIDIYGQNDHIFLLFTENHLDFLDAFGGNLNLRNEVINLAKELRSLLTKRKELQSKEREREQKLDFLEFQINEIENARLKEKEDETLLEQRIILQNAEKILLLTQEALEISYHQENSISALLSRLKTKISQLSQYENHLKEYLESIDQASIVINDLSQFLIQLLEKVKVDPAQLEQIEERLNLIDKLKRKYGKSIPDILNFLSKAKKELSELSSAEEYLKEIEAIIQEKFKIYKEKSALLSENRKRAAQELKKEVEKELALLGMEKSRFKVNLEKIKLDENEIDKIGEKGIDEVEFYLSPNPGEKLRPLKKIASGGELSRIMLSLKSIGREKDIGKTLIFDEIDSGIGGKAAETVARKLSGLAERHQVICISHLPQIASFAPAHFKIEKKVRKGRTYTTVYELKFDQRIEEIAYLMSGSRITPISLRNAEEMLRQNLKK
ncbi:MAG: DNA repair protein RecN [Candidatus Aminicenantia bacterium]